MMPHQRSIEKHPVSFWVNDVMSQKRPIGTVYDVVSLSK